MVARKAHRARVLSQIRDANGMAAVQQLADQALAARRMGHAPDYFRAHADGDELHQLPLLIQNPHRGVLRVHLFECKGGNPFHQHFGGDFLNQFQAGAVQCHKTCFELFAG